MATTEELQQIFNEIRNGANEWHRISNNPQFIISDGLLSVIDTAGGYWLLTTIALKVAPNFIQQFTNGDWDYSAEFSIEVTNNAAVLRLRVRDLDDPAFFQAFYERVPYTDWPEGTWTFPLAVQPIDHKDGKDILGVVGYLFSED